MLPFVSHASFIPKLTLPSRPTSWSSRSIPADTATFGFGPFLILGDCYLTVTAVRVPASLAVSVNTNGTFSLAWPAFSSNGSDCHALP